MNLHRLLQTSAVRLSFRYILLFALLVGAALGTLYWSVSQYIDIQIVASLEQEIHDLQTLERNEGLPELQRTIQAWSNQPMDEQRYFLLVSAEGAPMAGSLLQWPTGFVADGKVRNIIIEDNLIPGRIKDDDGYWPMVGVHLPGGQRLLVAENIEQANTLRSFSLSIILLIFFLTLLMAVSMGLLIALSIVKRIDRISVTAREIMDGNLDQRVPLGAHNDEFDGLAKHLNSMLERIQQLMLGMKQVSDNIAHDLRKPLNRIKNRLEVSLLERRDNTEYQNVISQTIADTDDLLRIFSSLLKISQAEARTQRGNWEIFDLSSLCEKIGHLYQDQAETQNLKMDLSIADNIFIEGENELIGQSLSNLLENAIKYTPGGGHISLILKKENQYAQLEVCDDGPGIPSEHKSHVLERFVRLDQTRSTPGNGLGLSLVNAVMALHSATLVLSDNHPGLKVICQIPRITQAGNVS